MSSIDNNIIHSYDMIIQTGTKRERGNPLCAPDRAHLHQIINALTLQLIQSDEFIHYREELGLYAEENVEIKFSRDAFTITRENGDTRTFGNLQGIPQTVVKKADEIFQQCKNHLKSHCHAPASSRLSHHAVSFPPSIPLSVDEELLSHSDNSKTSPQRDQGISINKLPSAHSQLAAQVSSSSKSPSHAEQEKLDLHLQQSLHELKSFPSLKAKQTETLDAELMRRFQNLTTSHAQQRVGMQPDLDSNEFSEVFAQLRQPGTEQLQSKDLLHTLASSQQATPRKSFGYTPEFLERLAAQRRLEMLKKPENMSSLPPDPTLVREPQYFSPSIPEVQNHSTFERTRAVQMATGNSSEALDDKLIEQLNRSVTNAENVIGSLNTLKFQEPAPVVVQKQVPLTKRPVLVELKQMPAEELEAKPISIQREPLLVPVRTQDLATVQELKPELEAELKIAKINQVVQEVTQAVKEAADEGLYLVIPEKFVPVMESNIGLLSDTTTKRTRQGTQEVLQAFHDKKEYKNDQLSRVQRDVKKRLPKIKNGEPSNTPEKTWISDLNRELKFINQIHTQLKEILPGLKSENREEKQRALSSVSNILCSDNQPWWATSILTFEHLVTNELPRTKTYAEAQKNHTSLAQQTKDKLEKKKERVTQLKTSLRDLFNRVTIRPEKKKVAPSAQATRRTQNNK